MGDRNNDRGNRDERNDRNDRNERGGSGGRSRKVDGRDLVGRRCCHIYDQTTTGKGTIVDFLGYGLSGDPVVAVKEDRQVAGTKPHPMLLDELIPL